MSQSLYEFEKKFFLHELKIAETDFWIWSLRPHQATLGSGILSLKRECPTFGELYAEEHCELNKIVKIIEKSLKKSFNFDVLNYLMLMMVDKQVHFHVIPRYENPMLFNTETWIDEGWPKMPNLLGEPLASDKLNKILQYIKTNL